MSKALFSNVSYEEDLSSLEDFIPLQELVIKGGAIGERAKKIINQFASNSSSKVSSRNTASENHSSTQRHKKAKTFGIRR